MIMIVRLYKRLRDFKKGQLDKPLNSIARFSTSISCVETPNEKKRRNLLARIESGL